MFQNVLSNFWENGFKDLPSHRVSNILKSFEYFESFLQCKNVLTPTPFSYYYFELKLSVVTMAKKSIPEL